MDFEWLLHVENIYLAAFLTGLLGSIGHCIGMCGGIVGALTINVPTSNKPISTTQNPLSKLPILLGYNIGRLSSYMIAGALMGGLGSLVASALLEEAESILRIIAAVFMILLGLYLAGLWKGLRHIESVGSFLWKGIEPVSRHFMPVSNAFKAIPFGFFWGWLPCGLVYSVLIWSLSAGSALSGALLMLAFGLGTLPVLIATGMAAAFLSRWTKHSIVRLISGLIVVVLGVFMLLPVITTL